MNSKMFYIINALLLSIFIAMPVNSQQIKIPNIVQQNNQAVQVNRHIVPEKITKKESKNWKTFNAKAKEAFANIPVEINVSQYAKDDPEFKENKELIKNNVYKKGDKIISSKNEFYTVFRNNTKLRYENGSLSEIVKVEGNDYPVIDYVYKPNGKLVKVDIDMSDVEFISFAPNGRNLTKSYNLYVEQVNKKIKANWKSGIDDATITAKVLIKVNNKGDLLSMELINSSLSTLYNNSCLDAVKKASFFEPFPSFWQEESIDILMTFDIKYYRL